MRDYLAEPIFVRDIARHLGICASSLAHRYRTEARESPMQSLIFLRIELVKGLLMQGLPLKAIAENAGFCDVYHLSKRLFYCIF